MMNARLSRREALGTALAAGVAAAIEPQVVKRHDEAVERILKLQITEPTSRWRGIYPDDFGLHHAGTAGGILETLTAAFLQPASKFHRDRSLVERMRLAAGCLGRGQNEHGNIDLVITNFNSPPDTAFVVENVATAAGLARRHGERDLEALAEPFLRKAAGALAVGGVHTPNHRWVVCAALAQLNELYPDPALVRRIDQWLAEGIDIDEDGQYTERSTLVYNVAVDHALVVMAAKLKRPELLEPVRRNLQSMLYLVHPGDEVVTEISRRQDQYERGAIGRYWFPLRYLAVREGDGRFAALADRFAARYARLSALMEYPELSQAGPPHAAVPEFYERQFPALGIARIRRGPVSATLILGGGSRFFTLRRGAAVVNAVRFASAFFGKGQFIPQHAEKRAEGYFFRQSLEGDYLQPLDKPYRIGPHNWYQSRAERRRTELCKLEQSALVSETYSGFRLRIQARGTDAVPVAVEINLREGGTLEGCEPVPRVGDGWLLSSKQARYRAGGDEIRFGPGLCLHRYTQVRMAEPKLPGPSVYLTGFTPFDHTLDFDWGG
ncbi:MAG: hypothetical protein FJW34_06645 [Acidobacteria bacterium]|nr:hypothetical protein [Acidobacteriota bacterium]